MNDLATWRAPGSGKKCSFSRCRPQLFLSRGQPLVTVYALLPSHVRTDRWFHGEPEWNYLAEEIEEFARQFAYLDDALEELARAL